MIREIPPLSILVMKEIAKNPIKYLQEQSFHRSQTIVRKDFITNFDLLQTVINYVTEAGRFSDDTIPLCFFSEERLVLSLKNSKITSRYLLQIIERSPNLIELDVGGTFHVDDNMIEMILKICRNIKILNIRSCRKLTSRCFQFVETSAITSLNIGGDTNLNYDGIYDFLKSKMASRLTELSLAGLPVNDAMLQLLSKNCRNLKKLSINYADVSESSIRGLLEVIGPQVEVLGIAWVGLSRETSTQPQLSSDFLDFLGLTCPMLHTLDISGIKSFNINAIVSYLDNKSYQVRLL
jgi:hypothetical protein